jgi:hypothetical protein
MILNEEQREEFDKLVKPMVKWLNENCHPHVKVIIEGDRAELVEGVCSSIILDFIRD